MSGWQWVHQAEAREHGIAPDLLERFARVEPDGEVRYWMPAERPDPADDATLFAVDSYRASVVRFAAEFLDNKPWAAEAVHRAIRDGRPIRLPPLPAAPGVKAPADLQIDLRKGDDIPYDIVEILRDFTARIPKIELVGELGPRERKQTWKASLQAISKRLKGQRTTSTERSSLRDARRYLSAAATGKLRPHKRRH